MERSVSAFGGFGGRAYCGFLDVVILWGFISWRHWSFWKRFVFDHLRRQTRDSVSSSEGKCRVVGIFEASTWHCNCF